MFAALLDALTRDLLQLVTSSYAAVLTSLQPLLFATMALLILHYTHDVWANGLTGDRLLSFCRQLFVLTYAAEPRAAAFLVETFQIPAFAGAHVLSSLQENPASALDSALMLVLDHVYSSIHITFAWPGLLGGVAEMLLSFFLLGAFVTYSVILLYLLALSAFFTAAVVTLLPYAVALYGWDYTRPVFHGLLRQGISFALIPPVLYILLAATLPPTLRALNALKAQNLLDIYGSLLPALLTLLVASLLSLRVPAVVSGVAGGIGMPLLKPSMRLR